MSEEMHNLLGKYFSGQVTDQEKNAVEEWAGTNEENASEFRLLKKIWTGYDTDEEILFNTDKAWKKSSLEYLAAAYGSDRGESLRGSRTSCPLAIS